MPLAKRATHERVLFPFTGRKCFTARRQEGEEEGRWCPPVVHPASHMVWSEPLPLAGPASPALYHGEQCLSTLKDYFGISTCKELLVFREAG